MPTKLETLGQVRMFRGLPGKILAEIEGLCRERTYQRGETVFSEGEPARGLFVVWRGAVKVYKIGEGGREQILEIEGPGRSVAELPLFDGSPYPASCAALEESILLELPSANCLGEESRGLKQVRGNGCLAFTKERLLFQFWVGERTIEIPLHRVTGTSIQKTFLGKTKGYPLLVVAYESADGEPDRCAFMVRKPRELQQRGEDLLSDT